MTLYVFRRPYSAIRTLQYLFMFPRSFTASGIAAARFLKPATCKAYSAALLCAAITPGF